MNPDLKKIKTLTKLMKKEGLLTLKTPEIELSLAPQAIDLPEIVHKESGDTAKGVKDETPQYSPEDVLLWSAPGLIPHEVKQ